MVMPVIQQVRKRRSLSPGDPDSPDLSGGSMDTACLWQTNHPRFVLS